MIIKFLSLAIGGMVGTVSRYLISGFFNNLFGINFPYGTFIVNMSGSFLVGLLWGIAENVVISPNIRTFIFIGCLGGFTTFSTFMLESLNYFREGNFKAGILNLIVSNIAGIVLAYGGFLLSKIFTYIN